MPNLRRMRRAAKKRTVVQPEIGQKIMNSFYETKRIDGFTLRDAKQLFEEAGEKVHFLPGEEFPSHLADLCSTVASSFRLDYDYEVEAFLVPPPTKIEKKKMHSLPPYPENSIYRIVVVSGSHEIFVISQLRSFFNDMGVFVPTGSAVKIVREIGTVEYSDQGRYDQSLYPGKGIKRPEERHLIVLDFISTKEDERGKAQIAETQRAAKALSESSGVFDTLLKAVGIR
jgi:hypothetical protein